MTLMSGVVKTINKITKSLKFQTTCTVSSYVSDGGVGDGIYKDTKFSVVVERKQRNVTTSSGELVVANTTITFIQGNVNIYERDFITLADGSGGPVLTTSNPLDASGKLITEAYLG